MSKLMAYYRMLRSFFLATHPRCELYTAHRSEHVHHARGRVGTLLLDMRFWKALCPSAHDFVSEKPTVAKSYGLLCQKGQWNTAPNDEETKRLKALMRELAK